MPTFLPTRWLVVALGLVFIFYGALFALFYQESRVAADSDAKEYVTLGQNIFSAHEFSRAPGTGAPEVFRTPGYPLVAGLVLRIFHSLAALVWLQIGVVALSVWLVYLIGQAYGYPKIGLAAGWLYALDPATMANTFFALSEITFVALFLASLYLLLFRVKFSLLSLGWGSALLGASILVRPVGLYILPLVLLACLFFRYREIKGKVFPAALILILGLAITLGPWLWRNEAAAGEAKLSSVGEYNALFYNAALFKSHQLGVPHQQIQDEYRALFPAASAYDYLSFKFGGRYKELAFQEILGAPVSYFAYHLLKTAPFFVGSGVDNYRYLVSETATVDANLSDLLINQEWREFFGAVMADPVVLLERLLWVIFFGLAFLSVFIVKERRLAVFGLVLILWVAVLTGPVAMPRYHLPVSPFVFLLALMAGSELRRRLKTAKNKSKYA